MSEQMVVEKMIRAWNHARTIIRNQSINSEYYLEGVNGGLTAIAILASKLFDHLDDGESRKAQN